MKNNNAKSVFCLFLTAFIWGTGFVTQTMGGNYMQPFTFVAIRYFLGGLVILPLALIIFFKDRKKKAENRLINIKQTLCGGVLCGIALCSASLFQQYGVMNTTVGKAGFITAMYIIITPIFGLFLGKKCSLAIWIGAAAAVFGMYLLCINEDFSLSFGDLLMLVCAALFSVHIMIIDRFSPQTDGVVLSCLQFFTAALLSGILSLIFDKPTFSQIGDGLFPLLYCGIMSSGVAYTLQIVGQRNFNPTIAAMIMSLESVISAVAGYFAFKIGFLTEDQSLSPTQIIGCAIIFCAVIFVQLRETNSKASKKALKNHKLN